MAASRTALLLLGLVVLATMAAGAEANKSLPAHTPPPHTCKNCPSDFLELLDGILDLEIALSLDLSVCLDIDLELMVGGVVKSDRGKALTVAVGGEVTKLGPLKVHLKAPGVLDVKVRLLAEDGITVVATVALDVPLADAVVVVVGSVLELALKVVLDVETGELLFFTGNVHLHTLSIRAFIKLLGLVKVGLHVGLLP